MQVLARGFFGLGIENLISGSGLGSQEAWLRVLFGFRVQGLG